MNEGKSPQFVAKEISDLATEDAIFTCNGGTPTIWAARYLKMNGKRRLLGSLSASFPLRPGRPGFSCFTIMLDTLV